MKKGFLLLVSALALSSLQMAAIRPVLMNLTFGEDPAKQGITIAGKTDGAENEGYYYISADNSGKATWTMAFSDAICSPETKGNSWMVGGGRLRVVCFTPDADPDNHITAKFIITSKSGAKRVLPVETLTCNPEITSDVHVDESKVEGDMFAKGDDPETVVLEFAGLKEGDIVMPISMLLTSGWMFPQVSSADGAPVTYINALDFDEPWISGREAGHSANGVAEGYAGQLRGMYDVDYKMPIHSSDNPSNAEFYKPLCSTADEYDAQYALWPSHFKWNTGPVIRKNAWTLDTYKGEYKDATSNIITLDEYVKAAGWWVEYTFELLNDGADVNLSLKAGAHLDPANGFYIGANKFAAEGKDRADGGFAVEGHDYSTGVNFLHAHYGDFIVSLDGEVQEWNYETYPYYTKPKEYGPTWVDPTKWAPARTDANGKRIYCHRGLGIDMAQAWNTYYNDEEIERAATKGFTALIGGEFPAAPALEGMAKPDYTFKNLKAGKHTIRVCNLGGLIDFNELKLTATGGSGAGIEGAVAETLKINVTKNVVTFGVEGEYEIYSVAGILMAKGHGAAADISALANGVYVLRVNNQVVKFVK